MRPHQWIKNLFVFAPLVFSRNLTDVEMVLRTLGIFAAFSATASGVYLINDVADYGRDRYHPTKRHRPIASGAVMRPTAMLMAMALLPIGIGSAYALDISAGIALTIYVAMNAVYTHWLKHIVLIDAFIIAFGFILRVSSGAFAISVGISAWLLTCTFFISLFLAFGKRRHELVSLGEEAAAHRMILADYSTTFIDNMISALTAMTVMSYALYTIDPRTVQGLGTDALVLTVPFVLFGIFRYLHLVHHREGGGSPTMVVLTDRGMQAVILVWFGLCVAAIYFDLQLGLLAGGKTG